MIPQRISAGSDWRQRLGLSSEAELGLGAQKWGYAPPVPSSASDRLHRIRATGSIGDPRSIRGATPLALSLALILVLQLGPESVGNDIVLGGVACVAAAPTPPGLKGPERS